MKTILAIIICLLFCLCFSIGMGQEKAKSQYIKLLKQYQQVFNEYCKTVIDSPIVIKRNKLITRQDLFDYFQECYNDSSRIRVHKELKRGESCIIDWECISLNHYEMIWTHKEPTLQGFKEWLEKH